MESSNKDELLAGCAGDIGKRLSELAADVAHVQSLIDNAHDSMTSTLQGARRHVLVFRAVADKLLHELPEEDHTASLSRLDDVQEKLKGEANKALRSLQCHDLVTQILSGMQHHLRELEIDMRALTSVASAQTHYKAKLVEQGEQAARRMPPPRRASIPRDLTEGEVELFQD